tara:strand:+ start:331 stop:1521 length:1191 start_codon:yes stop_codon:yes gene_type:complete
VEYIGIYILLLFAIATGWVIGRISASSRKKRSFETNEIFTDYFVGLNYLLNDEPDEAIDTFIRALEINSETVETHLALGALLRRRGKVDKAIKIHQNLLARQELHKSFSDSTRLQLAIDYISAGLLDRAERLLNEILKDSAAIKWDALRYLITIYQTEKEWVKAISCSSELLKNPIYKKDQDIRAAAAHYCCELAEQLLCEEKGVGTKELIKKAFTFDKKNVRATLLLARTEQSLGNYKSAIKELVRVRTNNPEFISQVLGPLAECYEQIHNLMEYEKLLINTLPEEPDVSVVISLSGLVKKRSGDEAAISFLNDYLVRKPSLTGLVELLKLQIPKTDAAMSSNLNLLQQMLNKLVNKKATYQCHHCGYQARSLYWLCPSCQKWDKIKPILEAGGS